MSSRFLTLVPMFHLSSFFKYDLGIDVTLELELRSPTHEASSLLRKKLPDIAEGFSSMVFLFFFFLFVCFLSFETGSCHAIQADLELTLQPRMISNSQ